VREVNSVNLSIQIQRIDIADFQLPISN